ncbi:SprT family zinc-dependent metalloprotease [Granulosicoccaceae sp. 1_MG-2023]|nr:SprT family zinc-dependent metalloprotease [Granulosicoccaceae sp. 1_MG-2023]
MPRSTQFEYTVRVSARARRVNLRVRPESGLEVVVPKRFRTSHIPEILEANRPWIEKALRQWREKRACMLADFPPKSLALRALGRHITVQYRAPRADRAGFSLQGERLVIYSEAQDQAAQATALQAAVRQIAVDSLPALLAVEAARCGLRYGKVTVRGQRSRWGSCSSAGNISLNYKLLFLEPALMRYVLCHELAHLRHLNHSPAYWQYLESILPGARALDRRLDQAGAAVPVWLHGGMG